MGAKRFFRIAVVFSVFFSVLALSLLLWKMLLPFLFPYILLFALKPLVNLLYQRGVPHLLTVLIVFFGTFGGFVLLLVLLLPALFNEFISIQDNLKEYVQSFTIFLDHLKTLFTRYFAGFSFFSPKGGYVPIFESYLKSFLGFFVKNIPSLLSTVILYCMVIPFATFFLLLDEQRIIKKMIRLVPNRYFEITINLLYNLNRQFSLILRGMFISVVIISVLSSIGLWLIGLHYPIIVGVIAGISNLIPYAGPVVGVVVAFMTAVMTGSSQEIFFSIILVFVIVQLIDNVLVQPIVLAKSANLHPLLVLFLVILGSSFGGVIGMFAVVPLVSLSQIVVKILFDELKRPPRPDFSLYRDIQQQKSCP